MKVTVVGSGTVVPHPERVCAAYWVETGGHRILLDCGAGALHHLARFGLPWSGLTHVVLSHFHTDHVADLPILFFALRYGLAEPRREDLTIVGPGGTVAFFQRLASAFGNYMLDPGFGIVQRELGGDATLELDSATRLRTHATPHTGASLAYRVETPEGVLGYTGDTGPSDALGAFFKGVDILIAECSLPDELAMDTHLTPGRVAALARRARPRRLVLTHIYPQLQERDVPALVREAGWDGETIVARDGLVLEL